MRNRGLHLLLSSTVLTMFCQKSICVLMKQCQFTQICQKTSKCKISIINKSMNHEVILGAQTFSNKDTASSATSSSSGSKDLDHLEASKTGNCFCTMSASWGSVSDNMDTRCCTAGVNWGSRLSTAERQLFSVRYPLFTVSATPSLDR